MDLFGQELRSRKGKAKGERMTAGEDTATQDMVTDLHAPLASRMRPRTLEEFVGQEHLLGEGKLLKRTILADRLTSLILYGPPGIGKTTLAFIISNLTGAHFRSLNAVTANVQDLRKVIEEAKYLRAEQNKRTILFI